LTLKSPFKKPTADLTSFLTPFSFLDVEAAVGHHQDNIAGFVLWATKDGVSKLRLI
jgi:hypothetical protein